MSWLDKFVEKNKPVTYAGGFRGDVCQVMAQAGYVSFRPFQFFPVRGSQFEDMAAQQCREFIVQNGGEDEPRAVIRLVKYTPVISKEEQPHWRDGENSTQMSIGYSNDPDWVKFSEQFREDGILPDSKFGQKIWVHVLNVPYPSFVKDDPSTHKKWNSWTNTEGEPMPSFMPIVQKLFGSEEEARAWYKEQVVDVATVSNSNGMTWKEAVEKTMPMPVGWDQNGADGWTALPADSWVATATDLIGDMINKNADPAEYARQWNGPITAELLTQLKGIGLKYNPF